MCLERPEDRVTTVYKHKQDPDTERLDRERSEAMDAHLSLSYEGAVIATQVTPLSPGTSLGMVEKVDSPRAKTVDWGSQIEGAFRSICHTWPFLPRAKQWWVEQTTCEISRPDRADTRVGLPNDHAYTWLQK